MDWFNIYKIANSKAKKEELKSLKDFAFGLKPSSKLDELVRQLKSSFLGLDLYVYETLKTIHVSRINVPKDQRGKGIGSKVLTALKDYARQVSKPLVLVPEAERGKKQALEDFYKSNDFVYNKGRRKDWNITVPFAKSMYWKP